MKLFLVAVFTALVSASSLAQTPPSPDSGFAQINEYIKRTVQAEVSKATAPPVAVKPIAPVEVVSPSPWDEAIKLSIPVLASGFLGLMVWLIRTLSARFIVSNATDRADRIAKANAQLADYASRLAAEAIPAFNAAGVAMSNPDVMANFKAKFILQPLGEKMLQKYPEAVAEVGHTLQTVQELVVGQGRKMLIQAGKLHMDTPLNSPSVEPIDQPMQPANPTPQYVAEEFELLKKRLAQLEATKPAVPPPVAVAPYVSPTVGPPFAPATTIADAQTASATATGRGRNDPMWNEPKKVEGT